MAIKNKAIVYNFYFVVFNQFDDYRKGDLILEPNEMEKVIAEQKDANCRKVLNKRV